MTLQKEQSPDGRPKEVEEVERVARTHMIAAIDTLRRGSSSVAVMRRRVVAGGRGTVINARTRMA